MAFEKCLRTDWHTERHTDMINAILRVSPVDEVPRVFCHCAAHVSDHHFSDQSNYHRRQSIFCCCYDISLEQLAGSSPFFGISGAVQKVAEDGTVYAILYRLTNN